MVKLKIGNGGSMQVPAPKPVPGGKKPEVRRPDPRSK